MTALVALALALVAWSGPVTSTDDPVAPFGSLALADGWTPGAPVALAPAGPGPFRSGAALDPTEVILAP